MEKIRKISKEQVVMAFVATCIETTARQLNTNYNEIYQRMERVGMKRIISYPTMSRCTAKAVKYWLNV